MRYYNIPPNKSEASPGNIIFFDTETNYDPDTAYTTGQYHRLRLGVAVAGRLEGGVWTREKVCRFKTAKEFWEFVASRSHSRIPTWLYAHNIGFDLQTIEFPERLWSGELSILPETTPSNGSDILRSQGKQKSGFVCLENPPVILSAWHRDGWHLIAVDTFNYWTSSLSKIGEMIGHVKTEMPALADPDSQWFDYCENDVRVLQKAVLGLVQWTKQNDLGKFRFTAPSQAMAAFRHKFYSHKITCHDNTSLRSFERQAYYGGRLEAWYIGETGTKTYELDVTSLYPFVMDGNLYPHRIKKFATLETHTSIPDVEIDIDTLAEVKVKCLDPFPKRICGVGTIYPKGEYWTCLAGPELCRANQQGSILEIRQWVKFNMAEVFTQFVRWFWNYRHEMLREGRELEANLAKLLMNGLYGKFGQKTSAWIDRPDMCSDGSLGNYMNLYEGNRPSEMFRNIGKTVQQWTGKKEHPYAFPSIAAYVTSYAREYMHTLRRIAGHTNCYYIATDALFCNETGYRNLDIAGQIADNELGALKVKASADTATFSALHHYKIGDREVKGSRKKSARDNPDGTVTELHFQSLETALKRKPDASVHVTPVIKKFSKEYTRGVILESGWVEPLTLWEE